MGKFLKKVISIIIFILLDSMFCTEKSSFMPNLPVGTFKIKFKVASICNDSIDYPLKFKYFISKPTPTQTLLKGNVTLKNPFDDRLYFNMNLAVWSKIGGWKDNAFIFKNKGACSNMKFIYGNVWNDFLLKHHFTDCPVKPGFYKVDGFDLSQLAQANITKRFFYGTYKPSIFFTDEKNVQHGCLFFIIDILRPWE
ncbi:uncharacterized protein LOC126904561 [Daktulosphaira vitifoliae]|uniref:uncharacterized protein LOC126904561 n=1 Tax=Daktulosphaira vitifoliae TaxID=58002 RepID=UPI0021A99003|nr:uncharacterized protein LOC126904561 [Daktulosphaira vitifoliae]